MRYWLLFGIAAGMAFHACIVGRFLGSSFFLLAFFWGWVAACAYRGRLDLAQTMAITMIFLLFVTTVIVALLHERLGTTLAYYTFALFPALVSWLSVSFYIRHLQAWHHPVPPGRGAPRADARHIHRRTLL